MNRIFLLFVCLMLTAAKIHAQIGSEKTIKLKDHPMATYQLSGYVITKYSYTSKDVDSDNGFSLRMIRATLKGRILNDFAYTFQYQFNGTSNSINGPRVVDANVEWQKLPFLYVKLGQFKRAFTFENPMNPIDQGFYSYGEVITRLSGFNDRVGEHASNGRDIGLQLQGDLLSNKKGRKLLHYQLGVYNGNGINLSDNNDKKDFIGGLWLMPTIGLRTGAFGWLGTYARKGSYAKDEQGNPLSEPQTGTREVKRNRYALSVEYKANDWTLRSEYIHSKGRAFANAYTGSSTNAELSEHTRNAETGAWTGLGDTSDGWYALVIAPLVKNKLHAKARYQTYRQNAEWDDSYNQYELGLDWMPCHNLVLDLEYNHSNDRRLAKHDYDLITTQVSFRF